MKSIMISIKPEWVEKILNGEKTIEIRKTKPKCELPCKVYIYCIKGKTKYLRKIKSYNKTIFITEDKDVIGQTDKVKSILGEYATFCESGGFNAKVVAEFTLNKVEDFSKWEYDYGALVRHLNLFAGTRGDYPFLHNYLKWQKKGYAWHIDDLKIYDEPKELSDFKKENKCHYANYEDGCCFENCTFYDLGDCDGKYSKLENPLQSWCYVEELENE